MSKKKKKQLVTQRHSIIPVRDLDMPGSTSFNLEEGKENFRCVTNEIKLTNELDICLY